MTIPAGEGEWHEVEATATDRSDYSTEERARALEGLARIGKGLVPGSHVGIAGAVQGAIRAAIKAEEQTMQQKLVQKARVMFPERSDKGHLLWLRGDGSRG